MFVWKKSLSGLVQQQQNKKPFPVWLRLIVSQGKDVKKCSLCIDYTLATIYFNWYYKFKLIILNLYA